MHTSSGHIKILSASSTFVGLVSSWLSSSSVSVGEVGLRLCLIAAKLFGSTEVTVIDGTFGDDGRFNLLLGMNFPGPMSYALQTRMLSFSNLMLFKRLTPGIFSAVIFVAAIGSHKVTFTDGTPPEDKIASFIWSGVSMSFPEFK